MTSVRRDRELKYQTLQAKSLLHNQSEMHVLLNCDWDAGDVDFTYDRCDNITLITLL